MKWEGWRGFGRANVCADCGSGKRERGVLGSAECGIVFWGSWAERGGDVDWVNRRRRDGRKTESHRPSSPFDQFPRRVISETRDTTPPPPNPPYSTNPNTRSAAYVFPPSSPLPRLIPSSPTPYSYPRSTHRHPPPSPSPPLSPSPIHSQSTTKLLLSSPLSFSLTRIHSHGITWYGNNPIGEISESSTDSKQQTLEFEASEMGMCV